MQDRHSVALVMTSFEPGGTERQMIELIRRLDRERWDVHVACFHTRGAWFGRVADCARVAVFPVRSFGRPGVATQLRAFAAWCRTSRIALVHTFDMPATIFGLPAAASAGVPVRIANRRVINPGRAAWKLAAQRAAYACAHLVVANSRAVAARLAAERVPPHKIALVRNGLPVRPAVAHPERPGSRQVITVANLRREKGYDVLIDAAPEILRRCPGATFRAVGAGPELVPLTHRTIERHVEAAFTFGGHCENVSAHLAEADVFVLPSRSDAMPNALLEAMAAGLPIVAAAVGGIPELIEDGVTGLLVPPDDPASLADAVCRLLADPALAARVAEAARQSVSSWDSFDDMTAAFEAIYTCQLRQKGVL